MKEPLLVPTISNQQEEANILLDGGGGEDGPKEEKKKGRKEKRKKNKFHLIFEQVAEKKITQTEVGIPRSTFHEQFHDWVKRTNNKDWKKDRQSW